MRFPQCGRNRTCITVVDLSTWKRNLSRMASQPIRSLREYYPGLGTISDRDKHRSGAMLYQSKVALIFNADARL